MESKPQPELIIGQTLMGIAHSPYSEPEFVLQGIGPASFRQHYLTLANGLVLDLYTARLEVVEALPADSTPGETMGLSPAEVLGRRVTAVACDDTYSAIIVLEGGLFLKDANDGCYGNPLLAGRLADSYTPAERSEFLDYWSEQRLRLGISD